MLVHTCLYTHACTHACTHMLVHTCLYTQSCIHMLVHTCLYTKVFVVNFGSFRKICYKAPPIKLAISVCPSVRKWQFLEPIFIKFDIVGSSLDLSGHSSFGYNQTTTAEYLHAITRVTRWMYMRILDSRNSETPFCPFSHTFIELKAEALSAAQQSTVNCNETFGGLLRHFVTDWTKRSFRASGDKWDRPCVRNVKRRKGKVCSRWRMWMLKAWLCASRCRNLHCCGRDWARTVR
jgi:hypothetical protein